jgi:hypothetical protein
MRLGPESKLNGILEEVLLLLLPLDELYRWKEWAHPPGVSCASKHNVLRPYLDDKAAHDKPPKPAPRTITSTTSSSSTPLSCLVDDNDETNVSRLQENDGDVVNPFRGILASFMHFERGETKELTGLMRKNERVTVSVGRIIVDESSTKALFSKE